MDHATHVSCLFHLLTSALPPSSPLAPPPTTHTQRRPEPPPPRKQKAPSVVISLDGAEYQAISAGGKKLSAGDAKFGAKLLDGASLDGGASVEVTFTPKAGGEPFKPQQAMLMVVPAAAPKLAAYAVAKARRDGGHTATLSAAAVEKQLGPVGGAAAVTLLLGDPSAAKGVRWELGSVELPAVADGVKPKPLLRTALVQPMSNLLPNIAHTFVSLGRGEFLSSLVSCKHSWPRLLQSPKPPTTCPSTTHHQHINNTQQRAPEKRAPAAVSLAFAALALAPLAALVAWLAATGALDLSGLPSGAGALWAAAFHGGIASLLLLYWLFWTRLDLATTLPLALALGAATAGAGYKALSALADARLQQERAAGAKKAT